MKNPEVKITSLENSGRGVGVLPSGKTMFVEGALPGEVCSVEVISEKARFAEARAVQILVPSVDRTISLEEYYSQSAGCDLCHMSYELTIQFKQKKVRDCLTRIGRFDSVWIDDVLRPIVESTNVTKYRNHMQYFISDLKVGLVRRGSNDLASSSRIQLEYDEIETIRSQFESVLMKYPTRLFSGANIRGSKRSKQFLIELVSEDTRDHELIIRDSKAYLSATFLVGAINDALASFAGSVLAGAVLQICNNKAQKRTRGGKRVVLHGEDFYQEKLFDRSFMVKAGAFFQVNVETAESLYSVAKESTSNCRTVFDLFCGTGTIGLSLVNPSQMLYGIDSVPEAIASAKMNAESSGITNCKFVCKAVEKVDLSDLPSPDVIIVDPPRKGMDLGFVRRLVELAPPRIVYISCDPATMARDLIELSKAYKIESVTPVDMFPWTNHVESVVLMCASSEAGKC